MLRIAANKTGIGSRIKCLLSAMRMAEFNGDKYRIYFPRNHYVGCEWHDLFENDIEIKTVDRYLKYPGIYYSWRWNLCKQERIKYDKKYYDFMFNKMPEAVISGVLKQIPKLILIEYCRKEIEDYKKLFDKDILGVSIRTWKETKRRKETERRNFNIYDYYKAIDEHLVDKLFLNTDHEKVYKYIKHRYDKRVLYYPKRTYCGDNRSIEGLQDILIDLYLTGNAPKMIVSWHSNFTALQWFLGGARANVIITGRYR